MYFLRRFSKDLRINKLEVSDTAGTSATPKTGGIHGNYVDYVVLQTNHHRHESISECINQVVVRDIFLSNCLRKT